MGNLNTKTKQKEQWSITYINHSSTRVTKSEVHKSRLETSMSGFKLRK